MTYRPRSEMWSSICSYFGVKVESIRVIFCNDDYTSLLQIYLTQFFLNHVLLQETELWDRRFRANIHKKYASCCHIEFCRDTSLWIMRMQCALSLAWEDSWQFSRTRIDNPNWTKKQTKKTNVYILVSSWFCGRKRRVNERIPQNELIQIIYYRLHGKRY